MALHSSSRKQLLLERARFMRHHPTYSEALLWSALRGKRLGVQFRRQQLIGQHIVDFIARQASLVVAVDGDVLHAHQAAADARRDERLRRAGYRVLRIPASLVERDLEGAVVRVREALNSLERSSAQERGDASIGLGWSRLHEDRAC